MSTTQRGYGWQHQQARNQALRRVEVGDLCTICNLPIQPYQLLDFDHELPLIFDPLSVGRRLVHAECNRGKGAGLGRRRGLAQI